MDYAINFGPKRTDRGVGEINYSHSLVCVCVCVCKEWKGEVREHE